MNNYTTEELIKTSCECSRSECDKCPCYTECCNNLNFDLRKSLNDRLESQQKEIDELKKKLAETYTAEQYLKDLSKLYGIDDAYGLENSSEKVREWAKSHPEKPKVTNGDKAKEIFGKEFNPCNICGNAGKKCDDLKECGFDFYEWWKSEYKEPENG